MQKTNITELIIGISGTDELYDIIMDIYFRPYNVYKNDSDENIDLFITYGLKNMYNLIKKDIKMQIKENLKSYSNIKKISIIGINYQKIYKLQCTIIITMYHHNSNLF
jgi:hypothetical protein